VLSTSLYTVTLSTSLDKELKEMAIRNYALNNYLQEYSTVQTFKDLGK
jgi:hypothetical protein